jgi:hypothetical protein
MPRSTVATNSIVAVFIMVLALVAGCALSNTGSPTSSSCDGIDAQLGGCDPDRPTFVGQTCEAVGRETGKHLNDRLLVIYRGSATAGNESRAVRANHVMTVTTTLANAHLRSIGIIKECGVDEFMAAANDEFTAEFKRLAGVYLNDGPAMTFDDWLAEWKSVVQIIDMEEG